MSLDRVAALRQAEKLLRLGKLDQAIAEYQRLVDEQPRDWNTGNLLGDLLLRSGETSRAVEQFTRIADSLRTEGFLSKATALYKKVLKLQPDSEHALMQAGELASQQGLLVDARSFLSHALDCRRRRGETNGAWEIVARIGALDPNDVPARLDGARARIELGEIPAALREFRDIADLLVDQGHDEQALSALREIIRLDPTDLRSATEAARILIAQGHVDEAIALVTPDRLGSEPPVLLFAAELRIRHGSLRDGLTLIDRLLSHDVADLTAVGALVVSLAAGRPDTAYVLAARAADARTRLHDWNGAARILRQYVEVVPQHVKALTRLREVCVAGGLQDELTPAQRQLVEANIVVSAAAPASVAADASVTRRPEELRPGPQAETPTLPADDALPAQVLAQTARQSPARPPDLHVETTDDATVGAQTEPRRATRNSHAIDLDALLGASTQQAPPSPVLPVAPAPPEIDLSLAFDEAPPPEEAGAPRPDLDAVFAQMRASVVDRPTDEGTELAFIRAGAFYDAGDLVEAAESFRAAARSPRRRFAAALMLSRIARDERRLTDAIDWLGHAIEAPASNPIDHYEALLLMADLLEATGEPDRALAACLELQAEAGDYKDVATRLARLSGLQGGG